MPQARYIYLLGESCCPHINPYQIPTFSSYDMITTNCRDARRPYKERVMRTGVMPFDDFSLVVRQGRFMILILYVNSDQCCKQVPRNQKSLTQRNVFDLVILW